LPQYNGNCLACTGPGYYCTTDYTCWSSSNCGSSPCIGSTCLGSSSLCATAPSAPAGSLPQYFNNCPACATSHYYCAAAASCWTSSTCGSSPCIGSTCLHSVSSCSNAAPSYTYTATHNIGATRTLFSASFYSAALHTVVGSTCTESYPSYSYSASRWVVNFRFSNTNYVPCNTAVWSAYSNGGTQRLLMSTAFSTNGFGTLAALSRVDYTWGDLGLVLAAIGAAILAVIIIAITCCFCITGLIIYCACVKKSTVVVVQQTPMAMNQPYQGA